MLVEMRARRGDECGARRVAAVGRSQKRAPRNRERENNARGACVLRLANENRPGRNESTLLARNYLARQIGELSEEKERAHGARG